MGNQRKLDDVKLFSHDPRAEMDGTVTWEISMPSGEAVPFKFSPRDAQDIGFKFIEAGSYAVIMEGLMKSKAKKNPSPTKGVKRGTRRSRPKKA